MKNYQLTLICLFLASACFSQGNKIDSSQIKTIRLDPKQALGRNVSDVFEQVKYIPLETTKESTVGEITQLEVLDNRLIVFDIDTWAIYIFDGEGCYLNKITARKVGELNKANEQNTGNIFNGFNITTKNGKEVIDIRSKNSVLRFNTDGKFIEKINNSGSGYSLVLQGGSQIIPGYWTGKDLCYEFAVIRKSGDTALYLPFNMSRYNDDDYFSGERLSLGLDAKDALYSNYYSYELFEITNDKVAYRFKVILPTELALPKDFLTNPIYKQKKWPFLVKNKNVVYGISNTYSIGDYLYLKLDCYSQFKSAKKNIAYNIPQATAISLQDLTPDKLSFFLPVEDSSCGTNFMSRGFLKFDGKNVYTAISALCMLKFGEQNKENPIAYPQQLQQIFTANTSDLNPILVKLKPKTK